MLTSSPFHTESPLLQEALKRGEVPYARSEGGRGWFRPAYGLPDCDTLPNQEGHAVPMVPLKVAIDHYQFLPFGSQYHGKIPWWYPRCELQRHEGLEPVMLSFRQGDLVFGTWDARLPLALDFRLGQVALAPATYACWRAVFAQPLRLF
jgi:hypothetical protein